MWRNLCGRSFQVVGALKEKDLWPKVLMETRGTVRIRESVDERRSRGLGQRDSGNQRGMWEQCHSDFDLHLRSY